MPLALRATDLPTDTVVDGVRGSDDTLALRLMRDTAHRSLERTRAQIAERGDNGQSMPLPMPEGAEATIGQALEAAFFHLEALKRRSDAATADDCDPLDWSEELLEFVDIAHLSRAKRG